YGFGNDPNVTSDFAHSGRASYNLSANPQYIFSTYDLTAPIIGTSSAPGKGLSVKLWLKSLRSNVPGSQYYGLKNTAPALKAVLGNKTFDFKAIAQTGEWTLYSADIQNFQGLNPGT